MSTLAKAIRSRRESHRSQRELTRALEGASQAMRDELLVIAQRQHLMR